MKPDARGLFFGQLTVPYSTSSYSRIGWRFSALTLLVALMAAAFLAHATQDDLVIRASGFTHQRGQAMASLFRDGDDIFGEPLARAAAQIDTGQATLIFPGVQHGNYAVVVFHDENGNNKLDHNLLRMPAEPLGFSNGFKLTLFSGLPSFEKLRFAFAAGAKPVVISVK